MSFSKKIKIFILLGFFLFPFFSGAEILTSQDNVYIKTTPEFPGANQLVSVSLEGYLIDLSQADILWYKNNKLQERGVGETSYSFETGDLGDSDVITAKVINTGLGTITKTITISPSEVDLIWESDSLTPPFYKGKALNSYQSVVRLVAIPNFVSSNGSVLDPEKLIYEWKQDWKVLGNNSGYGKNILVLDKTELPKNRTIIVEVRTTDYKIKGRATIDLKNESPEIIFYKKDPVLGVVYDKALMNTFELKNDEITVVAYPYFFSKDDVASGRIKYNWIMNNKKMNDLGLKNIITLKQSADSGITKLSLEIQNLNRIMQFVKNSFNISFGDPNQQNEFFGSDNF